MVVRHKAVYIEVSSCRTSWNALRIASKKSRMTFCIRRSLFIVSRRTAKVSRKEVVKAFDCLLDDKQHLPRGEAIVIPLSSTWIAHQHRSLSSFGMLQPLLHPALTTWVALLAALCHRHAGPTIHSYG
jgi:hypothetical protein